MTAAEEGRYLGQFRPEFSRLYLDRDLYWAIPFSVPTVLAIVGKRFAGVGTVIEYLQTRHGYMAYTLGSELRTLAEERGVPVSHRRYLQDLGDQIRTECEDAGYLARLVLRRMRADHLRQPSWSLPRSVIVGGLKTPKELEVISSMRNFRCLNIQTNDDDRRFGRVLMRGELEEEYEADRERREVSESQEKEIPAWSSLSCTDRRDYFDELDRIHEDGHPGGSPQEFKGAPAKVIAAIENPLIVQNDFDSIRELHAEIDRVLAEIRPAQQIVHH
jgi:hypothetical protein